MLADIDAAAAAPFHIIGPGLSSCGTWVANRGGHSSSGAGIYESWVVGFLSGIGFVNDHGADPLNGVDAEAVWAWVDNYCGANPLDTIEKATIQFYIAHPR